MKYLLLGGTIGYAYLYGCAVGIKAGHRAGVRLGHKQYADMVL